MAFTELERNIRSKSTSTSLAEIMAETSGAYTENQLSEYFELISVSLNSSANYDETLAVVNAEFAGNTNDAKRAELKRLKTAILKDLKKCLILKTAYNTATAAQAINAIKAMPIPVEQFDDLPPNTDEGNNSVGKDFVQIYSETRSKDVFMQRVVNTYTQREAMEVLFKNTNNKWNEAEIVDVFQDLSRNTANRISEFAEYEVTTLEQANALIQNIQRDLLNVEFLKTLMNKETATIAINYIYD